MLSTLISEGYLQETKNIWLYPLKLRQKMGQSFEKKMHEEVTLLRTFE